MTEISEGTPPRGIRDPDPLARIMDRIRDVWAHVEALERAAPLRNASVSGGQGFRVLDESGKVQAHIAADRTITVFDEAEVPVVRMGQMRNTGPQPYGVEVRVNATDWIQLGTQSVAWANVGNKPGTYDEATQTWTVRAHTHPGGDVTSRVASAVDAIGSASGFANNVQGTQFYALWVGNDGQFSLGRNTSSIRYKMNVRDADPRPGILDLRPVIFDRKPQFRDPVDEDGNRVEGPAVRIPGAVDEFGLIAEEVLELVPELVQWFDAGDGKGNQVDGVRYELIGVALVPAVRDHDERIARLESTVKTQADQIEKLMDAVKALGGSV